MATHDYVIDNQSAPSFRSDLNNALNAIVTQNSSTTAPATTYANMIWYDTANNQIKKRNEANSAWLILGTVNEVAGTFTPSGQGTLASQAEAEAGIDNTKLMTPLRTAQAIAANSNTTLLGTISTASGSSASVTGLVLTNYKFVRAVFDNVFYPAFSTGNLVFAGVNTEESTLGNGFVDIDLTDGTAVFTLGNGSGLGGWVVGSKVTPMSFVAVTNVTTASTSITVSRTSSTFAGGSIRIFGMR